MKDSFTVLSSLQTETLPLNNKEQLLTHSPRDEKADNQILSGSRVNTKPIPAIKFPHRHAGSVPFYKVLFLLLGFVLAGGMVVGQVTVTYTMQTGNFNSLLTEKNNNPPYTSTFNNGTAELGQYANSGWWGNTPGAAAFETFNTTGNGTSGTARTLKVGDRFTITGFVSANPSSGGYIGISFRNSTTYTNFFSSTDVNTVARFQLDNTGNWKVYSGSTLVGTSSNAPNTDATFTIEITSTNTFNATIGGTTWYDLSFGATGPISSFAIYTFGDGNANSFWKNASLTNFGHSTGDGLRFGYDLSTGTRTVLGIISDGVNTNSTSVTLANVVKSGGSGGFMIFSGTNTYSGSTTVNSNGRLELQNTAALGSTSGVTVQNNAALSLYFASGTNTYDTYATTLNGAGVSGANGALRSTGGNNTWPGGITLASSSRINADASGAAGSLALSGAVTLASNTLTIGGGTSGVTISGKISGTGVLAKDGDNTLTLSNTANDYSGGTVLSAGTIPIANNAVLGSGDFTFGSGSTTSTLDITDNTSRSGIIKVVEASTAGVINVASGKTFTLNGAITSTGTNAATKFGKSGPGTFIVNANGSTYPGQIQIGDGTVVVQNNGGLGTNNTTANRGIDLGLNVGDVSTTNNVVLQATTGITVPQSIYVATNAESATRTIGLNGTGSATFNNEIYLGGNLTVIGGSGTVILSGSLISIGGLIVNGGTVVLSGANTYTGATTITLGELRLNPAANSTPATQFVLNGGTLSTTGITASRTISSSSTLQLNNTSTIALGSNAHTLTFAASNGLSWVSGKTITITGWTGSSGATGTTGKIFVGSSSTGLTPGQLAQISFAGYTGTAAILPTGEIVPSNDVATAGYRSLSSGNWNTSSAWEYANTASTWAIATQVPGSGNSVTIKAAHAVAVDAGAATCAGLTIESTASLTINAGKSLTVNGTLTNSATFSGLVIKSDANGTGSLIEHSGVAATVQRYIMNDFKWHFLSSPVSSQAIWPEFAPTPTGTPLIFAGGPTYGWDFYYYNPKVPSTGLYWVNLRKTGGAYNNGDVDVASDAAGFGTTTPTFTVGKGYLVAYNATPFSATHTFIGNLNYGMVTRAIVSSPNSYNLVGNPYPSSIDWDAASGWDRTVLAGSGSYTFWIWNDAIGNYGSYGSYTSGGTGTNGASRFIAPGQAFFVKAVSNGSLGMNNDIRAHSTQAFLKNSDAEPNLVRVKLTSDANTYSDEMVVEFNAGFTGGGSDKFWSFYAESPEIYSVKDGNNYSIDRYSALEDNMTVNIAAKTGVAATYTITAVNMADFSLSDYVWLKDKKTGIKTNLKLTPAYSFEGSPGDDRNRFQLIFGAPNGTEEDPADGFTVFSSEGSIFVKADNARAAYSLLVTNMPGQIIKRVKLMGNDIKCLDQKFIRGVYIVTIYSEGNMFSKKVVIM